jgi:uncharacterized protein
MRLSRKMSMSFDDMEKLLHRSPTGRLATIDSNGYPVIIPLNFVLIKNSIYFHSAPVGEKLQNIQRNPKVGFEVDQYIATLPCYYFEDSQDPSETDTLYRSIIIRGHARLLEDNLQKILPLQRLMEKYQPEGGYETVHAGNIGLQHAAVVEIAIDQMSGKEKIGQHWHVEKRLAIAQKIYECHSCGHDILKEIGVVVHENNGIVTFSLMD